jgi:hypothetical protein
MKGGQEAVVLGSFCRCQRSLIRFVSQVFNVLLCYVISPECSNFLRCFGRQAFSKWLNQPIKNCTAHRREVYHSRIPTNSDSGNLSRLRIDHLPRLLFGLGLLYLCAGGATARGKASIAQAELRLRVNWQSFRDPHHHPGLAQETANDGRDYIDTYLYR